MRNNELFMYEDELPSDITDDEYSAWFALSWIDGVRIGPIFDRGLFQFARTIQAEYPAFRFPDWVTLQARVTQNHD